MADSNFQLPSSHLEWYILYGLKVSADLPLLASSDVPSGKPDVTIRRSADFVPEKVLKSEALPVVEPWLYYHQVDSQWWAEYRDVLWMKVTEDSIGYYPLADASEQDIKTYILGTGLSLVLQLRGYFPLHGSMVVLDGKGILFTGHRGAGKSTTAAWLVQQGARLVTDDVVLVRFTGDGRPEAVPAFPMLKLWGDALDRLGVGDTASLEEAMAGLDKKRLPVADAYAQEPAPLDLIVELSISDADTLTFKKISGLFAFEAIAANIYRAKAVEALARQREHFQFCTSLAQAVPVYQLMRPDERWTLPEIETLLRKMEY